MRSIWIQNINAGSRQHGLSYSEFMSGMAPSGIELNRKMLSELATNEPYSFKAVTDVIREHAAIKPKSAQKFWYPTPEHPVQTAKSGFFKDGELEPLVPGKSYVEQEFDLSRWNID